jgi:beta-lactamase family protein
MRTFPRSLLRHGLGRRERLAYSALIGCSNSGQSNLSGSANQTSASGSPAEPTDANRLSRSQAVLDQAVQGSEPGCSAAVGRRGEILWTGVAGVSNLQRRDPITADTVFDAGSVSKQFAATAVLLLQQEGKLSVDDRLSRHVDGPTGLVRSGDARPPDASRQRHPRDGGHTAQQGLPAPRSCQARDAAKRRLPPDPDNARQNSVLPDDRPAMWCGLHTHEREREREAPDTLTRRRERIAGIHGISIDTIELYERNMIDELALKLMHGSYR